MDILAKRRARGARIVIAAALLTLLWTAMAVADDAQVIIDNFTFSPETLTIKAGTKVVFVNHDDIPHTIVAVARTFRSKALDTDESFSFTFAEAGTFDYFCGLHPHMKGKIIVAP